MSLLDNLNKHFIARRSDERFEDSEIDEIALLLERAGHPAATCPRTYIVLRTIRQLDVLENLLNEGFGDHWFPVGSIQDFPSCLEHAVVNEILETQSIIQTEALDFEHGKHLNLETADNRLFNIGDRLGSGNFGQVDKIVSKISFKEYALKRIRRRVAFGNKSKEAIRDFLAAKERMKGLNHPHIVQYIGSYTDTKNFGLVMSPVADCDLATYLQAMCDEGHGNKRSTLQSFFGCLATALSFLHGQSIKHKDIKPENVLVQGSNVIITDFGISQDFLDTSSGATVSIPRYNAPEVAKGGQRDESADIWSLGCVFIEMIAALQGHDFRWIHNYFLEHGSRSELYHENVDAVDSLMRAWSEEWKESEESLLPRIIQSMLTPQYEDRPQASGIVKMITSGENVFLFCGICCVPDDSNDSEMNLLETNVVQSISEPTEFPQESERNVDAALKTTSSSNRGFYAIVAVSLVVVVTAISLFPTSDLPSHTETNSRPLKSVVTIQSPDEIDQILDMARQVLSVVISPVQEFARKCIHLYRYLILLLDGVPKALIVLLKGLSGAILLRAGYVFTNTLTHTRFQQIRSASRLNRATEPVLWFISPITTVTFFLSVLVFIFPIWLGTQFPEGRFLPAVMLSLILVLQFFTMKKVLGNFISRNFDIEREIFNAWFGVSVSMWYSIVGFGSILLDETITSRSATQEDLQAMLDLVFGIFFWVWIVPTIYQFLWWIFAW